METKQQDRDSVNAAECREGMAALHTGEWVSTPKCQYHTELYFTKKFELMNIGSTSDVCCRYE